MAWNTFKEVANKKLDQQGVWQQAKESLVIEQANSFLLELFGKEINHKAQAIYLKDGILTIAILSDDWQIKIYANKHQFLQVLNNHFHKNIVKDLQFLS